MFPKQHILSHFNTENGSKSDILCSFYPYLMDPKLTQMCYLGNILCLFFGSKCAILGTFSDSNFYKILSFFQKFYHFFQNLSKSGFIRLFLRITLIICFFINFFKILSFFFKILSILSKKWIYKAIFRNYPYNLLFYQFLSIFQKFYHFFYFFKNFINFVNLLKIH